MIQARLLPQEGELPIEATLAIYDGVGAVVIPGCRLERTLVDHGPSGIEIIADYSDRRWRWRDFGVLNGCYNQLDPHGKLIWWTVRSPLELAILCLDAMGETGYEIDMPPGLSSKAARILLTPPRVKGRGRPKVGEVVRPPEDFLAPGTNLPPTGTNPPINWEGEVPAQALQRLCDIFGRRVVYDLAGDRVLIARIGVGSPLPPGSIASESPSLQIPAKPDGVAVRGSPTRYQVRLPLEAVGEEWDGSYRPINELSYAPIVGAKKASSSCSVVWINPLSGATSVTVEVTLSVVTPALGLFQTILSVTSLLVTDTPTDVMTRVLAKFNALADPFTTNITAALTTAADGTATITFTAKKEGFNFTLDINVRGATAADKFTKWSQKMIAAGAAGKVSWQDNRAPMFANVRETEQLTYLEAQRLAAKSVWKCYRVRGDDISGDKQITVPGYGKILRRQQLVLLDTQVDQIVPPKTDDLLTDRATDLVFSENFYNGYSHDKPAEVYGKTERWNFYAWKKRDVQNPLDGTNSGTKPYETADFNNLFQYA